MTLPLIEWSNKLKIYQKTAETLKFKVYHIFQYGLIQTNIEKTDVVRRQNISSEKSRAVYK